ncbi:lamin tail domain-containing protein [Streptomyces sp. NPDC006332]|uniref:lamin tail domain-containing protein n=1 Tax=Streptomyces sp. NPDC006332 TaxID=3155456 RepID=UPI0033AD530D
MELTNTTRHAVSLDGWTLKDDSGSTFTFDHYRLAGRASVRVDTSEGRDTRADLLQDRRAYVWNNDHDTATLRSGNAPGATGSERQGCVERACCLCRY